MSNIGLKNFLKKNHISFIRSFIGDRFVKAKMKENKFNLGGEQSGHIILGDKTTTGDGILVSLEVINILKKYNQKPSKILNVFKPIPQILKNIKVKNKRIVDHKKIQKAIKDAEKNILKVGRILVRTSGTETVIRIMGESPNYKILKKNINNVANAIKNVHRK